MSSSRTTDFGSTRSAPRLNPDAEGESSNPNVPVLVGPLNGSILAESRVVLTWKPLPGYAGPYMVRLHDTQWNGQQAPGFQHDCKVHYVCVITTATQLSVPVRPGAEYQWWVHKPYFSAAKASFTVDKQATPPQSPDVPVLVGPLPGTIVNSSSVTLEFKPLPGYSGPYMVRLHDSQWNGQQAPGFQHDSKAHYLSVITNSTRVTVPVRPGAEYRWWVHRPLFPAAQAIFSVDKGSAPPPVSPNVPALVGPLPGATVDSTSVTLEFQPLPGYTGKYLVRLDDPQWNGQQAPGFQHDCNVHYLCIATTSTRVTVPIRPGAQYKWWVHKPNFPAAIAPFSTKVAPTLIDGRYRCTGLAPWSKTNVDVSQELQYCIDSTPIDATLEIPVGEYTIGRQILVDRRISITSVGKSLDDPASAIDGSDSATLVASAALNEPWGLLKIKNANAVHHLVFDGNKDGRVGSPSFNNCVSGTNNRYGMNAMLDCDDCLIVGNVFKEALCGTGLEVRQDHTRVVIENNRFATNGVHDRRNLWADGLTIHGLSHSQIVGNEFVDNTDIDLILGGSQNCLVQNNRFLHTANPSGGSFAALMIHKWPTRTADYSGTDISGNYIDGGPNRAVGTGIYVASEGWYPGTPMGWTAANPVRAAIHNNEVRNTMSGMYVGAQGFDIFQNRFLNTHGVSFRSSGGTLTTTAPIIISPTTQDVNFGGENTDSATRDLFQYQSWVNCVPNWPF